jgi:hypothetical protein
MYQTLPSHIAWVAPLAIVEVTLIAIPREHSPFSAQHPVLEYRP